MPDMQSVMVMMPNESRGRLPILLSSMKKEAMTFEAMSTTGSLASAIGPRDQRYTHHGDDTVDQRILLTSNLEEAYPSCELGLGFQR
jgi:hypothetical protein